MSESPGRERAQRPQTTELNKTNQNMALTIGQGRFTLAESQTAKENTMYIVPDYSPQNGPYNSLKMRSSYQGLLKKISANSTITGSTKRHSTANHNSMSKTAFGRYPVDSIEVSRLSFASESDTKYKSRNNMKMMSASVPEVRQSMKIQPQTTTMSKFQIPPILSVNAR